MRPIAIFAVLPFLPAAATAQADRTVVLVNGTPIRQSEVLERLWKRYGPDTLEEMVDEILLRQAAQAQKLQASPAEVDKRLSRLRSQFSDQKVFESQLEQYGSSIDRLGEELREQLVREKLVIAERRLSIKEEELKRAFETHRSELGSREGLHLRHILLKTEAEAKEIVQKVRAGGDFKDLAKEKSLAPTGKLSGGDYGFVTKGMLPPDIEELAFAMKKDDLRILPTPKGFHVLQALERRPAVPAEFAKVKEDLREMLLQEKIKAALPDFLRDLRAKAEIKPQGQ